MGDNSQVDFEEDDLDSLDDLDDGVDVDDSSEDAEVSAKDIEAAELRRIAARREIERRAEEKALNSRLDEWEGDLDEWDPDSDEWEEDEL
jgi:hypothetical protein